MKKTLFFVIIFVLFASSLAMAEVGIPQQAYSAGSVSYGNYSRLMWMSNNDVFDTVPNNKILQVTAMALNYFPANGGTIGRVDLCGRNSEGTAVWRFQSIYIQPKNTFFMTFPKGLNLGPGGYVEMGFTSEGPGTITIDINGELK